MMQTVAQGTTVNAALRKRCLLANERADRAVRYLPVPYF